MRHPLIAVLSVFLLQAAPAIAAEPQSTLIRSAKGGLWSAASTWEGNRVPGDGARVQIRTGHRVVYDIESDRAIRLIHVAGTLSFATDRDTLLNVGLIKIQAGDDAGEDGFDCELHVEEPPPDGERPALEVGSPTAPIAAGHTATIRLVPVEGVDQNSWPAIVCCAGRMDFHGAPLSRTWTKLGATAKASDTTVQLAEAVTGWNVGDRVLVTGTSLRRSGTYRREKVETEERTVTAIDGTTLTLDQPLAHEHQGDGEYRGEVANLSRNVVVESADPAQSRGHTMYHRWSAGSIGYAEFRHLGKEGVLGRYSLHYHLVGDTMRGSSVIGASIWDSGNRWLTIHGTNHLVVRDCVGHKSVGHGFFLEDGTESYNVLDRNLAVQAFDGQRLKGQALPFDKNDGAGFWWANSRNAFTRNVACENQHYGYRFDATKTDRFSLELDVAEPDGSTAKKDIRTLPFVRFDDNECHGDGLYGFNLGEGVDHVGPDARHPFVVRNLRIWAVHYALRAQSPNVLLENTRIHRCSYGIYHPDFDGHVYRNLTISETNDEPFSSSHGDDSWQRGQVTIDGLVFENIQSTYGILIPLTNTNVTGTAASHFRNVKLVNWTGKPSRAVVNSYGGKFRFTPAEKGVPMFFYDHFGPNRHARVVCRRALDLTGDGREYRSVTPFTGDDATLAEIKDVEFPQLLDPVDDTPPCTVITHVLPAESGARLVRGTTIDNGSVAKVLVNGQPATLRHSGEWELTLSGDDMPLTARAEDVAGNVEPVPHVLSR